MKVVVVLCVMVNSCVRRVCRREWVVLRSIVVESSKKWQAKKRCRRKSGSQRSTTLCDDEARRTTLDSLRGWRCCPGLNKPVQPCLIRSSLVLPSAAPRTIERVSSRVRVRVDAMRIDAILSFPSCLPIVFLFHPTMMDTSSRRVSIKYFDTNARLPLTTSTT